MVARAVDPIWVAIRLHPCLEGHRIIDPRVCCPMCCTDEDGHVKPGPDYKAMHFDQATEHVGGADHQRRLAEGRAVRGPVLVPVDGVVRHVVLCIYCSLTEQGYRRAKHHRMDGPTALSHVDTAAHARRTVDGRMALYTTLHPPGVRVMLPQDAL